MVVGDCGQLQAMRRQNQTEECLACFDEMLFYGVKPTTKTYDGEALEDPILPITSYQALTSTLLSCTVEQLFWVSLQHDMIGTL